MGKRAQLPVAEVRGEDQDPFALGVCTRVILKSLVDDYSLDISAVPAREMGKVREHAAEISEQPVKHPAPLALGPLRKGEPKVEKTHLPQTRPEPVT